jgi:hypothetical protein
MILFVSGQYAGAQYIHPIIEKWSTKKNFKWNLVATGASCKYWNETKIQYKQIKNYTAIKVSNYIDLAKPKLIITSASGNIELEHLFILEAKKKSIPTASFIDVWTNYLLRFKYKEKFIFPDYILAIDNRCKEEMIKEGIPQNLIKIIGQPYLESISKNVPMLGPNILLAGQPIKKYFGNILGYDETDFKKICLKAIKKTNYHNILNTKHPEEISFETKKNFETSSRKGRGYKDVAESHTVLGMFSMQMIIGYLWGRKVASIQPKFLKNYHSPLSRWGLIPVLKNADEVAEFIIQKKNCKKYKHEKLPKDRLDKLGVPGSIKRFHKFLIRYFN